MAYWISGSSQPFDDTLKVQSKLSSNTYPFDDFTPLYSYELIEYSSNGVLSWYPLEENGTVTTIADDGPLGNNLTNLSGGAFGAEYTDPQYVAGQNHPNDRSVHVVAFTSGSGYAPTKTSIDSLDFAPNNPFSISAHVNYDDPFPQIYNPLIWRGVLTNSFPDWEVVVRSDGQVVAAVFHNTSGVHKAVGTATGLITAGNWYHIAVTFDGSGNFEIYVNGVLYPTTVLANTGWTQFSASPGGRFCIGEFRDGDYIGQIARADFYVDQVVIYNRIITLKEVLILRNGFLISNILGNGIDTRPIDGFRQGVELNTIDKFFISTQPKLWGGSIKFDGTVSHLNETYTYGQSVSFAEFFGQSQFDDRLRKFDPVLYINLAGSYPFPLLFNEGPQQQEENTVEPLTIPFRKNSTEHVGYLVKGIHGSIEEGQEDKFSGTSLLTNFLEFGVPVAPVPFLDQGEQRIGDSFEGSIVVPGFVSMEEGKIKPYNDQDPEVLLIETSGSKKGSTMLPYGHKSATAGGDVYGPNQAKYGTDSITFRNRLRGSG